MDEVGVMSSEEALDYRLCIVHGNSGTYRTLANGVHLWALAHCKRHELTGELVFGVATGRDYQERFIAENALEEAMHGLRLEEHGPEDPPYGQIAVRLIEMTAKDIEELKCEVDELEEVEEIRTKHLDESVCPEQVMELSPWRRLNPEEQDRAAAERYVRGAHADLTPDEQYAIAQLSMQTRLLVETFDHYRRLEREAFKA
jgi:hypothetical protein